TQGEPMSALYRVAVDSHKHFKVERGDTVVFSSRIIPGNEKAIYRMMNHLAKRGADIIYGSMNPPVHVSGHASSEELRLVLNLVRPKYFMPIHGEYRQLARHGALAQHLRSSGLEDTFLLETGETLELDRFGARKGARVTVGRVCIDSGAVDDIIEEVVIRDRRHLSEEGFLLPIIAIDKHTGVAEGLPEIVSRGFIGGEEGSAVLEEARQVVAKTVASSSAEERSDWGLMKEKIRVDLRRYLIKQTARHPLIMPVILEV
ncbi:MAG: ribonuclease J, partial [Bryobacteraceae bacterium]